MENEEVKIGNRLIAEFMGYTYYHKGVDIQDEYKLTERKEIFSKVPIEVKEYPDDDQYYFKDLPNPDYQNEKSKRWRSDWETLGWDTLNRENYITDLKYYYSWDWLMPVVERIESLRGIRIKIDGNLCDIYKTTRNPKIKKKGGFKDVLLISEKHNDKLELVWTAVVKFIKKDFIK